MLGGRDRRDSKPLRPPSHPGSGASSRGSFRTPADPETNERWVETNVGGRLTLVRNQLFTSPAGVRRDYSQYLVRKDLSTTSGGVPTLKPRASSASVQGRLSETMPARPRSSLATFDPDKPVLSPIKRPASSIGISHQADGSSLHDRPSTSAATGTVRPDSSYSAATTEKRPATASSTSWQSSRPSTGVSRLASLGGSRPATGASHRDGPALPRQTASGGILAPKSSGSITTSRAFAPRKLPSGGRQGLPHKQVSPHKGSPRKAGGDKASRGTMANLGELESLTMLGEIMSDKSMKEIRNLMAGTKPEAEPDLYGEHRERMKERKHQIRRASVVPVEVDKHEEGVNLWKTGNTRSSSDSSVYVPNAFNVLKVIKGAPSGKRFWVDLHTNPETRISMASSFRYYGVLRKKQVSAGIRIFNEKEYIKGLLHHEQMEGVPMGNAEVWLSGVDTLLDKRAQLRELERRLLDATNDVKAAEKKVREFEGEIKVAIAGAEPERVLTGLRAKLEEARVVVTKSMARRKVAVNAVEVHVVAVDEIDGLMPSKKNAVDAMVWDAMKDDLLVDHVTEEKKSHQMRVMSSAIEATRKGWWAEGGRGVSGYSMDPQVVRRLERDESSSSSGIAEDDGESDEESDEEDELANVSVPKHGGYFARSQGPRTPEEVQLHKDLRKIVKHAPSDHWGKTKWWERKVADDEARFELLQRSGPAGSADQIEREAQHIIYNTTKETERRQREQFRRRIKPDVLLWPSKDQLTIQLEAMAAQGGEIAEFAEKILEKSRGREGVVSGILQQMRFPGLSKSLSKWKEGHSAVYEAKCAVIDMFHSMCSVSKVPSAGSSALDKFVFSNEDDTLILSGLNWSTAHVSAFANMLRGKDLTGSDKPVVPLMLLRSYSEAPLLTHLLIDHNSIKSDGAHLLVQAVVACKMPLRTLDVSSCDLGELGAAALVDLLCAPDVPLETLVADSNQMGDAGVAAIVDVIAWGGLQRLSLCKNMAGKLSGKAFATALGDVDKLQELDMSWNEIRGEAAVSFVHGLACNKSLTKVKLSWNAFGDPKAMQALATALEDCHVEDLNLSENRIGPKACFVLASCFQHNSRLKHICFDGNPITMQGARELLRCATQGSQGEVLRSFSFENCAMGTVAPSVFNPAEPAGHYILEMTDASSRRVMKMLIKLQHEGSGVVQGAEHVTETSQGVQVRKPFSIDDFRADVGDDQWELPQTGFIDVSFADTREAPKEKVLLSEDLMHSLRQQLGGKISNSKKVDMVQAAVGMSFMSYNQMMELLKFIPKADTQERVNLVCKCYHRLSDMEDPRLALDILANEERALVERQLGAASFTFFRNNPTGFHRLDLSKPAQREVLLRLVGLKNSMTETEAAIAEYYTGRTGGPRDLEGIGLSWRNPYFNRTPQPYSQTWSVPYGGMFDVDFVDVRKPDGRCAAMTSEDFNEWILQRWGEKSALLLLYKMSPNNKLKLLREITNTSYVCCEQVATMLKQFNPFNGIGSRVEIFVACFSRCVDYHGLSNVMLLLSPIEQKIVMRRLGPVNLFDEIMAVGYYELDLSQKNDRFIFLEVLHLSTAEPGDNLLHVTMDTKDFVIPMEWASGTVIPEEGIICFYYVRTPEVMSRIMEQGAYDADSKRPPPHSLSTYAEPWWREFCEEGCVSPVGSDWVYAFRCRRIRSKLAEKFESVQHCFAKLDADGGGILDKKELSAGLVSLGIWLHPQEIRQFLEQLDDDGSNSISIVEFKTFWDRFGPDTDQRRKSTSSVHDSELGPGLDSERNSLPLDSIISAALPNP